MKRVLIYLIIALSNQFANAQMDSVLFVRSYEIEPESKGELNLEIDNQSFFKDLEYSSDPVEGYTLPGLWLQPKLTYNPLSNLHLELGFHSLFYWGATQYPACTYQHFSTAVMSGRKSNVHFLPYFRANLQLGKNVHFVLGDIYGGSNHRLIEPLYNPELNLTADPEVGLQVLLDFKHWHFDLWTDWQSFIFKEDNHQESFIVGAASDLKFGRFTIPLQLVFRHIGGEIQESQYHTSVITLFNSSLGVRYEQPIPLSWLQKLTFDAHGVYYKQMSGDFYQRPNGYGAYASVAVDFIKGLRMRVAYMKSHDFISLQGNGYYGCINAYNEDKYYDNPQTINLAVEYSRELSKDFAFGARLEAFHYTPSDKALGYSAGVFLKANPKFLLKKFNTSEKTKRSKVSGNSFNL